MNTNADCVNMLLSMKKLCSELGIISQTRQLEPTLKLFEQPAGFYDIVDDTIS